ncbi:MAG TPA: hypothetical protein DDZ51_25095, partial [Planctomycetaceae bacterium]|nr:hypothetical protein [Planctomycetaceae bacterium]
IEVATVTDENPATPQTHGDLPESVVQSIDVATQWLVAAVQPDSYARLLVSATLLSKRLGEAAGAGISTADATVGQAAARLASALQVQPRPRPFIDPPAEKLVAQATLDTPRPVAEVVEPVEVAEVSEVAGVTEVADVDDSQATRLMQIELACNAALDVVRKQAARQAVQESAATFELASIEAVANEAVQPDAPPADELVRAQAVATACDLAAESLEKLAMSLRRAGDSLVRQAKASSNPNRSLIR